MKEQRNNCAQAAPSKRSRSRRLPIFATALTGLVAGSVLILSTTVIAVDGSVADALGDASDVTVLLRRAESGDARAEFALGMRYAHPDDSSGNDVEAVRWLRQAAEQGLAEAQYNIGIMYAEGRGVTRDSEQAAGWYRQAAEQGLASAQFQLGAQLAAGDGAPRDDQRAATWFERAARQGVPEAAYRLGVLYDLGRGVKADAATAMRWYERAAERGYHPAASRLVALRAANVGVAATPSATPSATSAATPSATSAATPSAGSVVESTATAEPSTGGPRSASAWLARLDPDHYTLQVLSNTDEASVRRYLDENFDDGEAGYFAFELNGKIWYTLVTGDFASYSMATAAAESLATRLSGPKPWARKNAIIQKAAKR